MTQRTLVFPHGKSVAVRRPAGAVRSALAELPSHCHHHLGLLPV